LAAPIADDLVGGGLEDVQAGAAAEIDDGHPGVILPGRHLERLLAAEHPGVEGHDPVQVGRDGGDVVEPAGHRHGSIIPHLSPLDGETVSVLVSQV
jgi:hypothetical protein